MMMILQSLLLYVVRLKWGNHCVIVMMMGVMTPSLDRVRMPSPDGSDDTLAWWGEDTLTWWEWWHPRLTGWGCPHLMGVMTPSLDGVWIPSPDGSDDTLAWWGVDTLAWWSDDTLAWWGAKARLVSCCSGHSLLCTLMFQLLYSIRQSQLSLYRYKFNFSALELINLWIRRSTNVVNK